jgi:hypothetical protein
MLINTIYALILFIFLLQEETPLRIQFLKIQLLTIQFLTLSIPYTQFILHMATYHATFKVIYLIWQNCILVIHSVCCPDTPKHVGQFNLNKCQFVHLLE